VNKKMTQAYEEMTEMEIIEFEVQTSEENEVDELLGDLNPRYFEERITLKEAKVRATLSSMNQNFNCFSNF
jgi:hypothetical protein